MKNDFAKNIFTLASGTAVAQVLLLLVSPLLTRLYSTEQFGVFGVFVSISSILLVFASLKYEVALPLIKSKRVARSILFVCICALVVISFVILIITLAFSEFLARVLGLVGHEYVLYLLPLTLLCCGSNQIFNFYCIRTGEFRKLSLSKIVQSISMAISQCLIYFISPIGLILGYILAFFSSVSLFINFREMLSGSRALKIVEIKASAKKYINYPKYTVLASLANTSSTMLPVILFSSFYSASVAGLYVLAHRVLMAPVVIIGSAVSNVFLSTAGEYRKAGLLGEQTYNIHSKLIAISSPLVALFVMYLPSLFSFVFGSEWKEAGEFSMFLLVWVYLVFTASPISCVLVVIEKQKLAAQFDTIVLVFRIASVVLFSSLPFADTVLYFSLLNGIVVLSFIFMVFIQLKVDITKVFVLHIKYIIYYLTPAFLIYVLMSDLLEIVRFLISGFVVTLQFYLAKKAKF